MIEARTLAPGELITEPGVYDISMEKYHGQPCDGPSISSSGLRTIWMENPAAYWAASSLNPRRVPEADKDCFSLGRAAHMLLLGEEGFREQFAVQPAEIAGKPWQGNRTECKAWKAEQKQAGKSVLTAAQLEQIRGMAGLLDWQKADSSWTVPESGLANSELVKLGLLDGQVERSLIWKDKTAGIWLKARPDVIPTASGTLADFKTTSTAAPSKALWDYAYHMQGALAAMGMRELLDIEITSFALVFVQTTAPFSVTTLELDQTDLEMGMREVRGAINTFARCLERREWPAGDGEAHHAIRPTWHEQMLARRIARNELPQLEAAE